MANKVKERASFFSADEQEMIMNAYEEFKTIIMAKSNIATAARARQEAWQSIVDKLNAKLYEDGEEGVFSVTLFKRAVCEFKAKAQESKFTVCEYSFDLEAKKQQEMKQHSDHKKEQYGIFVRWLKVNFSGMFVAWIHLKALRVFVESVLRYGIPVSYQALVLRTDKKRSKKLKKELASLFIHLDPTATTCKTHASCDIPELCQHEYFSYICYHINTNLLEIS